MRKNENKQWLLKINNFLLIVPNCADDYFQIFDRFYNQRSSKNLKVESLSKFFDSDKIKEFQL